MISFSLSKKLRDFHLNISLEVQKGTIHVVIGENGSGKTSLLHLLSGVLKPDSGAIILNGRELFNSAEKLDVPVEKRKIGYLVQNSPVFPHLTVAGNIAYGLKTQRKSGSAIEELVDEWLSRLQLSEYRDIPASRLSGGQKQRVVLARACITGPELLLFDEPFSGIDQKSHASFRQIIRNLVKETNVPCIVVTHDIEDIVTLGDNVSFLDRGCVIQSDVPAVVMKRPGNEKVAGLLGNANLFHGTSRVHEGYAEIVTDKGLKLYAASDIEGSIIAMVKPEDILISKTPLVSSARNTLQGKITGIIERPLTISIYADVGTEILTHLTRESVKDMDLKPGDTVFLTFKASIVHVIQRAVERS